MESRGEADWKGAEVLAETLESMGVAEGQRQHFANLSLFIATSFLHTAPDQAQYDLFKGTAPVSSSQGLVNEKLQ
jgi:hypothetical protein